MLGIAGNLSEYSLAEVFQLIEQRKHTGLLTIEPDNDSVQTPLSNYYLWFQGGRLMAMAQNLHQTTLLAMLQQRRWLTPEAMESTIAFSRQLEQPLGIYLKSKGLLSAEQLKLIFHAQVIQPVCSLFKLYNARFSFDPKQPLVRSEMTGLSISGTEVSLLGLRVLRDWSKLNDKLPDSEAGLLRLSDITPSYKLDREELDIWQKADGKQSIADIAKQLNFSLEITQKIAFRLTVIGLLKEVAIAQEKPKMVTLKAVPKPAAISNDDEEESKPLTGTFLNNLMGFLKKKVA
jgi:hypothetical protein